MSYLQSEFTLHEELEKSNPSISLQLTHRLLVRPGAWYKHVWNISVEQPLRNIHEDNSKNIELI